MKKIANLKMIALNIAGVLSLAAVAVVYSEIGRRLGFEDGKEYGGQLVIDTSRDAIDDYDEQIKSYLDADQRDEE